MAELEQLEQQFGREKLHNRPGLTGNHGDFPGQVRRGTLRVRFKCVQITPGLGNYLPELHLRRRELAEKYRQALEKIMNDEVFGYAVVVEVD